MYRREYDVHTHCHDPEVQLGAVTWASAKEEKKNEDASDAATRRRDISCRTALWVVEQDKRHGAQMHHFEERFHDPGQV